jgi:hypothetical protein
MQDLTDFMWQYLEEYFTKVHTSFPGVIVEYDAHERRATVQPSLKRRAGNKEYIGFPILNNVPVLFPGTKKWTIHFPLEKGDEVAVFICQRSLEAWKATGQDGIEDPDPRRYDLCDAYCIPGLQPQEFIAATEPGLQIIHKDKFDGELISQMLMTDDKVEVKYKKKSTVTMEDDRIEVRNDKCEITMAGEDVEIKSPKPIGINGGGNNLNTGSLTPYWTAESAAFSALNSMVSDPMLATQLGILDGMSGGLGKVTALGTALAGLCEAIIDGDEAAKNSSGSIIK